MSKPAILTVDDDPMVSAAITRDLRSRYGADYRIVQAKWGAEALAVLTKLALRGQPVALIASDQRMPEMTGIEMLEQARAHTAGTKYLLLTAYADTDVSIKAINDIGLDWCERAATVLVGTELEPGLEWVASTLSAGTLLSEVKESTRRISELVAAVRSYSQMDRASSQHIDVTDGLESTLVVMGHKLGDGVTVIRSYGADVPRIEAYAGELNQVWTNLIDNAVDAMDGAGTLEIATRADGDAVVVEVGDTGAGMPPPVAARAFEAFYTTKDVGKGTGLGLDIARRIVMERHGGTISIDSRPGKTVLQVRLPVRAPTGPALGTVPE